MSLKNGCFFNILYINFAAYRFLVTAYTSLRTLHWLPSIWQYGDTGAVVIAILSASHDFCIDCIHSNYTFSEVSLTGVLQSSQNFRRISDNKIIF